MDQLSRRDFMKMAGGAGIALAFASGCGGSPVRKFIPWVDPPNYPPPGEWIRYATVCRECPAGCGMHMMHRDGRVTKAEGNPEHPLNRGALCARGQSSVQGLYDPDRLTKVYLQKRGMDPAPDEWNHALSAIGARVAMPGTRVIVISDLQTGSLAEVIDAFAAAMGNSSAAVYYEPFNYEPLRDANRMLFGADVVPHFVLDDADFIISFGADYLETWISPVEFTRRFSAMHTFSDSRIGRAAYVGPRRSLTAANADTFIQTPAGDEALVAFAMLKKIDGSGRAKAELGGARSFIASVLESRSVPASDETVDRLVREFMEAEKGIALAGSQASASEQETAAAIAAMLLNHAAGRIGRDVRLDRPHALSKTVRRADFDALLAGITGNDVLIIIGANPVYVHPGAREHLERAGQIVTIGTMVDETASFADWMLPSHSPLESWGDYAPYPGIEGIMQPVMKPLYQTLGAGDILMTIAEAAGRPLRRAATGRVHATFHDWFSERWGMERGQATKASGSGNAMEAALRQGGVWSEQQAPGAGAPRAAFERLPAARQHAPQTGAQRLYLFPSIFLFDGRLANRTWMQEIPEPVSFIAWNSWLEMHPSLAQSYGVGTGDVVALEAGGVKAELTVRVTDAVEGHTCGLAIGQGHTALGRNAKDRGVNAFALLASAGYANPHTGVKITKTGDTKKPALMSATDEQHGRQVLKWIGLSRLRAMKPEDAEHLILPLSEGYTPERDLYPPTVYTEHRWAMTIDLQACIGCGACTAACYAENNIATVGEGGVARGRELNWLRVVPYRSEEEEGRIGWIPMLCQHCDAAPCEPVCPVFASVHNEEGLNAQIYNRCIGTRYCSNNCPYKVRQFNWFDPTFEQPLETQLNPEVTVRSRGVMEKCTFCVQRIRNAEYHAKREKRTLGDGEIVTACQQTCPAGAIVFGDLLDDASRVSRITRHDLRRYHVLEELNTKPAVTYLKRIANDEQDGDGPDRAGRS